MRMVPLLLVACAGAPSGWTAPRHVLVLSIDTLRRDALGRYGGEPTPNLDRWMDESLVLDDLSTCSDWTFAAVPCALQGRSDLDAGFVPRFYRAYQAPVPPTDGATLASRLHDAGFTTLLFSANPWLGPDWGTAQGYDVAEVVEDHAPVVWAAAAAGLERELARGADRWLLHVHLIDPHAPYDPPPAWLEGEDALPPVPFDLSSHGEQYEAVGEWPDLPPDEQEALREHLELRYHGEVRWLDDFVGALRADLARRGWLEDTLVLVWSDHGEQMFEHGHQSHAYDLYREENDGIAFLWGPGVEPRAWSGPTRAEDLLPTVLDHLGLPPSPLATGVPVGEADTDRVRTAYTVARSGALHRLRQGDDVLIFHPADGRLERYDLATDPGEHRNLATPGDPRTAELFELLRPEVERAAELVPEVEVTWPTP